MLNPSQAPQASFPKYGQMARKPIPTGPVRSQNAAPIRQPVQTATPSAQPERTPNGIAGGKSPMTEAGPGSSGYVDGNNERGILRRNNNERERIERPPRGTGVRGSQTRVNGTTTNVNAGLPRPSTEAIKTQASAPSAQQPTTESANQDAPVAAPVELSKEVKTDATEGVKDESAVEGWGATAPAAAGLPPARAPRLVEKNPHTLYVKGLPQPCTDDELRGLWKEDIRNKVSRRG